MRDGPARDETTRSCLPSLSYLDKQDDVLIDVLISVRTNSWRKAPNIFLVLGDDCAASSIGEPQLANFHFFQQKYMRETNNKSANHTFLSRTMITAIV
jgi:hypothetical protein